MEVTARNFWFEGKSWVRDVIGLSTDEAHVHLGLALFLLSALILRRHRHGLILAWVSVLVVQTLNELMDARDWVMWTGSVNWTETAKDYVLTLFWPTLVGLTIKRLSHSDRE